MKRDRDLINFNSSSKGCQHVWTYINHVRHDGFGFGRYEPNVLSSHSREQRGYMAYNIYISTPIIASAHDQGEKALDWFEFVLTRHIYKARSTWTWAKKEPSAFQSQLRNQSSFSASGAECDRWQPWTFGWLRTLSWMNFVVLEIDVFFVFFYIFVVGVNFF